MRLSVSEMRRFYTCVDFDRYDWRFRRKHFRIETLNGKWVKLNKQHSLSVTWMWKAFFKYVPRHAYMSVTDYLFPERVGRKFKAKYAVPMGGDFGGCGYARAARGDNIRKTSGCTAISDVPVR
jgi:hypothetical protein